LKANHSSIARDFIASKSKGPRVKAKTDGKFRILGIDPGTRVIGFAILESKKGIPMGPKDWQVVDAGVLKPSTQLSATERLVLIHQGVFELMCDFRPSILAIERSFHSKNAGSSIKLGEARGVLIAAASRFGIEIEEFAPTQIKKNIGGSGGASKDDLAFALKALIGFSRGNLPLDASDAVAIALTCSLNQTQRILSRSMTQTRFENLNSRLRSRSL
jgi:crossover junction endodeoxyribonuclease RuvC